APGAHVDQVEFEAGECCSLACQSTLLKRDEPPVRRPENMSGAQAARQPRNLTRTGGGRKAGEGCPRSKPGGQRNLKQADHRARRLLPRQRFLRSLSRSWNCAERERCWAQGRGLARRDST